MATIDNQCDKLISPKATLNSTEANQRAIQNQIQACNAIKLLQICKSDNVPATVPVMKTTPEAFFTTENERR